MKKLLTLCMILYSGNALALSTPPNCPTASGTQALNYLTSTNAFSCNTVATGSETISVGTTSITGGANTRVLFDNSGILGEYTISGTGNVVMSASPTLTGTITGGTFSGTHSGTGTALTALNASNLSSGTVPAAQMPALTGDVTTTAGAVATTVAKIAGVSVGTPTGTGNVVMSASPAFTGTVTGVNSNWSGNVGIGTTAPTTSFQVGSTPTSGNAMNVSSSGVITSATWNGVPIGTAYMTGVLSIANGGSAATTATGALNNFFNTSSTVLNPVSFPRLYDNSASTSSYKSQNSYGINLDPALIPHLANAFARIKTNTTGGALSNNRGMLICMGDSTTIAANGSGVSNRPNECAYAADSLTAAGIPAYLDGFSGSSTGSGTGDRSTVDTRVVPNSWAHTVGLATLGGGIYNSNANGSAFTFTQPNPIDTCVIFYYDYGVANTTATLQAGSGSTTALTEATNVGLKIATATTTLGVNACKVNYTGSGGATFFIEMMYAYDSTQPGLDIIDAGWWGTDTTIWNDASASYSTINMLHDIGADGVYMKTNINDASSVSQATFTANVSNIITSVVANGKTDFITGTDNPTNNNNQDPFVSLQYDSAISLHIPLIDSYSILGSYTIQNGLGNMSDTLHMTTNGYKVQSTPLANFLISASGHGGTVSAAAAPYVFNIGGTEYARFSSAGKLGIGTVTPKSNLDISGNLSIGTYGGVTAAPSNGMIVSGNVGIGTGTPISAALSVNGDTAITGYGQSIAVGTATTTWTSPAYTTANTSFKVTVIGGGGGGAVAGSTTTMGGGGGSGGACVRYYTGLTASHAYTIAVGAAGSNSTFSDGTTVLTGGGGGNGGTTGQGGTVGSCTNQTYLLGAQPGETGAVVTGTAGSAGGDGGGNAYGNGGLGSISTTGGAGTGCGGGGGGTKNGQTAGVGAIGCVLVEWIH